MSFLDKFKRQGRRDKSLGADDISSIFDEVAPSDQRRTQAPPLSASMTLDMNAAASLASFGHESSTLSEAPTSVVDGDFGDTRAPARARQTRSGRRLPLIGGLPLAQQQGLLAVAVVAGLLLLAIGTFLAVQTTNHGAAQVSAVSQAQLQSQRLVKTLAQAVAGQVPAFAELRDSVGLLARSVRGLKEGNAEIAAVPPAAQALLEPLMPLIDRAEARVLIVLAQQDALTRAEQALRTIHRQSSALFEAAEAVWLLKQQNAAASEQVAAGKLVMLTQRIGRSAIELLTSEGLSPEPVFLLDKDIKAFHALAAGLLGGSHDAQTRAQLEQLVTQFEPLRGEAGAILAHLPGLVAAREAQAVVLADSQALRQGLEQVQDHLATDSVGAGLTAMIGLGLVVLVLGGYGLVRVFVTDQAQRAQQAEAQRALAQRQEQEAKRVNDGNQAAILRLMNELQTVAEGDLTQQATVTEDITGAIADSVNYTVEELRTLVSQVQGTVSRVTDTTQQVENTSTELLAASTEQLREIRETGESMLQMAGRINQVSTQAQQTAEVARQSLVAAESGRQAVQNTIGGMNLMRDQIQETSKRIKRLGESSQEIGEITELISDITEQTNVLALNAAIQAASAGDAGRGFSVVAEEVQRLAERSGDAARQIAALVKAIQTDTQDAVAAMERSTQGVIESTRLSDDAGTALGEIDRVTHQLADLIEQISVQALEEARSANLVATNIQHIFAVTEQTGEGTRSTAQMVHELSRTADELKQSVARFKIE